jgi:hypothetical protein
MPSGDVKVGRLAVDVALDLDNFERQMKKDVPRAAGQAGDRAGREFDRSFSGRMKGFFSGVKKSLFSMQSLFVGVFAALAVRVGKRLFDIGSAVEETRSKFETVFGASSASVQAFIDDFGRLAGVTRNEGREILGTLGAVSQGLGMARDASAGFATEIFKLSADIGSFNNLPTEDVAQRITAALTGERESLKRLGIVVTEVEVQQRALNDTNKENVKALTQAEKATATLAIITEKAGVAVGDLTRTQDSSANIARRLSARFRDMRDTIAESLMPAMSQLLQLMDENSDALDTFAAAFGTAVRDITVFIRLIPEVTRGLVELFRALDNVDPLTRAFRDIRDVFQGKKSIGDLSRSASEDISDAWKNIGTTIREALDEADREDVFQTFLRNTVRAANSVKKLDALQQTVLASVDAQNLSLEDQDRVQRTILAIEAQRLKLTTKIKKDTEDTGKAIKETAGQVERLTRSLGQMAQQMLRTGAPTTAPAPTRARAAQAAAAVIRGLLREGATEFALYQRVLDQLGVTLDELAEKYPILAREIEETTDQLKEAGERTDTLDDASGKLVDNLLTGARAAINMASGLGVLGDSAALTLNQLVELGTGIARIAAGDILGGGIAAGGALVGLIGGLFGGGESAEQKRLREEAESTADALRRLADSSDAVARLFGGLTGGQIGDVKLVGKAVADAIAEAVASEAEDRGERLSQDQLLDIFRTSFLDAVREFGLTLSDLEAISAETGIEISALTELMKGNTANVQEAKEEWQALTTAIAQSDFSRIFESFSGQMRLLALEFDLLDITDAVDQLARLRETVAEFFGPELAARFEGLNLAEFEAELEAVFQEIKDGTFDVLQLEGLTFDEFLQFLQQADGLIDQIGGTVAGLAAAIDELNADMSRLSFEFQVFGTDLQGQFDAVTDELNEALAEIFADVLDDPELTGQIADLVSQLGSDGVIDPDNPLAGLMAALADGSVKASGPLADLIGALGGAGASVMDFALTLGDFDLSTQAGRDAAREAIRDLVSTLGEDLPEGIRGVILTILGIINQAEAEAGAADADRQQRAQDRARERARVRERERAAAAATTSQDFERIGSITIEELARSQAALDLHSFLLTDIAATNRELVRLEGGSPLPFALGALASPPQPPVSVTGGAGFSIGQIGPIGPFFVPEGSDPGGIDYDAFSEIMMSRIREALRASGQLGF